MASGVQTDMATPALSRFGSDLVKEEFLKPSISGDYVACRVADWRVVFEEPADINVGPVIPEDAKWKLVPTDPR